MEPITLAIGGASYYVATKFVDQFISQEGYGWFRKKLFPKQRYVDRLYQLIEETASEFEVEYPADSDKVPFYQSQPLFDALNQYVLFKELPDKTEVVNKFSDYPSVLPPTLRQLERFYTILVLKINKCKTLKKLHIEETYKEKIFDISDELIKIKLLLQSLNENLIFHLSDDWLNEKNRQAIADLGGRYTPELNLKLEIAKIFDGIGRTQNFSELFYSHIDSFLIKGKKLRTCDEIFSQLSLISKYLTDIITLYREIDFSKLDKIPTDEFCKSITYCNNAVAESESVLWKLREEAKASGESNDYSDKYSSILRELRDFDYECNKLSTFLNSITVNLSNNPFLLLEGEAGIGKSHLLADVIETRIKSGFPSLFLLGQQLTSDESPWVQIFKRLQVDTTSNDFLEKLDLYAKKTNKRFLIFIDAINEGSGNKFWDDNINSFVEEIKKYDWLGLIISVRSTYKNITISDENVSRNNFEVHEHIGFKNVELEAVNLFYDNYNIERPSSPNLNPEFKNPLFLKLLCEGVKKSGLSKVPVGFHGISKILSFFIAGVNKSLASPKKYSFDASFPLVNDALNELIKLKVDSGAKSIPLKEAHVAVQSIVQDYVNDKTFLNALIDEGLLTKGITRNDDNVAEEVVYISFERFDDHLTVNYLLDGIEIIEDEFKTGGRLKSYFKEEYDFYYNQGIVEALSIQLPEKYGKELYELLPEFSEHDYLINSFIDSLVWRETSAIDFDKLKPFINDNVLQFRGTFSHFLEVLISISGIEGHPFNANFLHDWLSKHPLPNRDAFWTTQLKYKYSEDSTFRHLIDWAWDGFDKSYISDDSIELVATALCWFLTSSNRKLRDCTTKALVNLLENRIPVLIRVIDKFDGVDDLYVWERVLAVTLGCVLRTEDHHELGPVAEIVYTKVFDTEDVYPHILLRDYAREIIEYVSHLGLITENIEVSKTKPPYKSEWPDNIPTKDELKGLYDKKDYWDLWSSVMGGGDFSRYTIGTNSNHSDWSGCRFGQLPVNRKEIVNDFKSRLSEEQLELFDSIDPFIYEDASNDLDIDGYFTFRSPTARKTDEVLSANILAFKEALSAELLALYEGDIEPYFDHNNNLLDTDAHFDLRLAERLIFNSVIELGWSPDLHGNFDRSIGTGRGRHEPHQERIGKKYQWIAFHEFMARLSDNYIRYEGYGDEREESPYLGPWEPYERDIDPTILLKNTAGKCIPIEDKWWISKEAFEWDCTFEDWVKDTSTLDNPQGLIEVKDNNGGDWLVLESYPSWKEPKEVGKEDWGHPRKEVWCHLRSYLVKSSEYEHFKNWADSQHYMGRWMPESTDRYQLFNREYYWSEAFKFFKSDYYSGSDWVTVTDKKTRTEIADVGVTAIGYRWEEEFDQSKAETLSFLKPSSLIFDNMKLKHGSQEGNYIDEANNIVCFAAEALNDTNAHLLVKKEPFINMLKDNGLEVVWTLLGEKGVIGGSLSSSHNYGRIEFSGAFYIGGDHIEGKHKIFTTR
ncbi:AVAST type 2 anti-phage system protein Avs2 [Photobacterium arenosum]|uniref:AVAST type 2 anti-phage system protein Avs2 n=1 Tax=Photobacterium arenosum TaxID=2774143 RepID=UPI00288C52F9|nr:AVAST type 2 anti-phage system protein Avs2 [Photobacterium arenosum]